MFLLLILLYGLIRSSLPTNLSKQFKHTTKYIQLIVSYFYEFIWGEELLELRRTKQLIYVINKQPNYMVKLYVNKE